MHEPETTNFADEGFGPVEPRYFIVEGNTADNRSDLLGAKILVVRDDSDDVLKLGKKHGLRFDAVFDDAYPSLAVLETIGSVNLVEHLAKGLAAIGYHRLPDPT